VSAVLDGWETQVWRRPRDDVLSGS
jgi:hypothetical protein